MPTNRTRIGSVKKELIKKARDAALSAVQIYNNPLIVFKSEIFVVNMIIAWTALLQAYFKANGIDFRYYEIVNGKKRYKKTKHGAYKLWDLSRCLEESDALLDKNIKNNLEFLIGLRNEIEHQMSPEITDAFSARFQACCINFNECIKTIFGEKYGIDSQLSVSLQFSSINESQKDTLQSFKSILPKNISSYVETYDGSLSETEYNSPKFAYRVLFTQKSANHPGNADRVIEFVQPGSIASEALNKEYVAIKEREKQKYRPKDIVDQMKKEGFTKFNMFKHTNLWKEKDAKNPTKGYGVYVSGQWYWYENWMNEVRQYCNNHRRSLV